MRNRNHAIIWAWVPFGVLVVNAGCGGSGSSAPGGLAGNWNGSMIASDASSTSLSQQISASGAITGTAQSASGTGPVYTEAGTMQKSGSFAVTGTSQGLPNWAISGNLAGSGTYSLGEYPRAAGNGEETLGTTQMAVTINLINTNLVLVALAHPNSI